MKITKSLLLPLIAAAMPLASTAQEEEAQANFIYSTDYDCDPTMEAAVDAFVAEKMKPIYDKAVDDGTFNAWGWLAHHTGGKWRRVLYTTAGSVDRLLDGNDAVRAQVGEATGNDTTLGKGCRMHDDYVWQSENVGSGGEDRGEAGISVYYRCDQNREDRADEIVEKSFGPVYDKLVADGKLASWGWSGHFVGGHFRRLATMTGTSHKALLAVRDSVIATMYADGDNPAGREFTEICGDHVDYPWNIVHEKP